MHKWIRFNPICHLVSHMIRTVYDYVSLIFNAYTMAHGTGVLGVGCRVSGTCTSELSGHIIYYMNSMIVGYLMVVLEVRQRKSDIELLISFNYATNLWINLSHIEPKRSQAPFRLLRCFLYLFLPTNELIRLRKISEESFCDFFAFFLPNKSQETIERDWWMKE